MTGPIRQYITLIEAAYQTPVAENYEINQWSRWWANMETGELVPVPAPKDHDEYLFSHLDDFLDQYVIDDIMADAWGDDYHEKIDEFLYAVYGQGWQAIIYDGNNGHLSMRTAGDPNPRAFSRIASVIDRTHPVMAVTVDLEQEGGPSVSHRITDPVKVKAFLRTGQLT